MAIDVFMKFEGGPDVRGESSASGREGEIEVMSFSWGASNPAMPSAAAGMGAGKVTVQDLSFTKNIDRASPVLFQACCSGAHFRSVLLSLCRSGGDRAVFAQCKFDDVLVAGVNIGGSNGGDAVEQVSLTFAKVTFGYKPTTAQGAGDRPVFGGFDLIANKVSASPLPLK